MTPTAVHANDASYNLNWGFMEFTFNKEFGLFANLSYVDFVGLPLGLDLQSTSSGTQSALGMPADGAAQVCNALKAQASEDGQSWDQLCVYYSNGDLLRVNAPGTMLAAGATQFTNYWDEYVTTVWEQYTSTPLTIDTQNSNGQVTRTVSGDELTCAGDNRPYSKPTAADIFGCASGPFSVLESDNDIHRAVVPRLCAAFHRTTFHLPGGDVQPSLPPTDYYTSQPTNWYSAIVHKIEVDGRGYAFPYDDVTPSLRFNTAGAVSAPDPQVLTVFVGGASG